MQKLLLLALILIPAPVLAITGPESRFDWTLGQPSVTANGTSDCNNEATARFDWVLGQPAIVHDSTATCTAEAPAPSGEQELFIITVD